MAEISRETAERIRDAWFAVPPPKNPREAMRNAGLKSGDDRRIRRVRRVAEEVLGINLPSLNPLFKDIEDSKQCPSTFNPKDIKGKAQFLITSATNNSKLNAKFFDALQVFCAAKGAQLLVCPIKYWHSQVMGKKDYQWDERIYPYVVTDKDLILNKSIQVSALSAKATAVDPLRGVAPLGGQRSVIYGATALRMEPIASHGKGAVKLMQTTGSCTAKTYTRTVAGLKAKFHHTFSAVFVLLIGNKYLHTQVIWDGKGFTFLNEYWTPSGKSKAGPCAAIVRGDDHAEWQEQHLLDSRARACDRLQPNIHVFHDVFDAISVSHHAKLIDKIKIHEAGMHSLSAGLEKTAKLIDETGGKKNLIIESNHDRHLERYVNEGRHLKDPYNAVLASELMAASIKSKKSMLRVYLEKHCKSKLEFPSPSKKRLIKNIDVSQHGDVGPNGSRATVKTFAKSMYKTVTGHCHASHIYQGAWSSGVSSKLMSYMKGLSSWTYSDVFIAANGKRFILFYVDGKSLIDYI